ncbi:MAG TPA: metallophosphoesterase [Gammaproteobacteria bacterium]|nr:metallophosphoesterase [Gammaproteobacteria bacterium]
MTTKIGLIADIHAYAEPLTEALLLFNNEEVDLILCSGDIAGYGDELEQTVGLLIENQCQTVIGNHDIWHLEETLEEEKTPAEAYMEQLPAAREYFIEGKSLYVVHARPPLANRHGIKLLDEYGELVPEQVKSWAQRLEGFEYDVLVVGHTHQVFAEQLGRTLVINPGSTQFNHSCGILSLPDMQFELFALSNETILKSWNWGTFLLGDSP